LGGGIVMSQPVRVRNSIVANNEGDNCDGTMVSHGYNLSSDGSCGFNGAGDLINTDPSIAALADNGGPTRTHALLLNSPAIDGGDPLGCSDYSDQLLAVDQRGLPRTRDGDGDATETCDIGAYELQEPLRSPSPTPSPTAAPTARQTPSVSPTPTSTGTPTPAPIATGAPTGTATPGASANPSVLAAAATPGVGGLPAAGGPPGEGAGFGLVAGAVVLSLVGGCVVWPRRRRVVRK
jgi:hypothetical protein